MKQKSSFFIWDYTFLDDRILIKRNLFLTRSNIIYTDKIEAVSTVTSFIMRAFGRCNIVLTFAGNVFTLLGVPVATAEEFIKKYTDDDSDTVQSAKLNSLDLFKKSLLQSHYEWYIVILLLSWSAVFLFSAPWFTETTARKISDFVFRHVIFAGTFVLSFGLPYAIIFIWAITGGFLRELFKYYGFRASSGNNSISYESGLLIRRKTYIVRDRIAIIEYKQTPILRIFGYGKLYVRAVGYNPIFFKPKPIFPLLREKDMMKCAQMLMPEMNMSHRPPRNRSFYHYLFTIKMLIPPLCIIPAPFFGYGWLIVSAAALITVIASCYLEYKNTYFESGKKITVLSKGGFYRTASCIATNRIELIAKTGSKMKLAHGFTNVSVHVFGKSGSYAYVKNIDIRQLDHYSFDDTD